MTQCHSGQFQKAYETIKRRSLDWTANPNQYRQYVEAGFGIWLDCDWRRKGWNTDDLSKNHFTPAEFEQSVRSALAMSDEYVWIYTEQPRWWTGQRLPKEYVEALEKARTEKTQGDSQERGSGVQRTGPIPVLYGCPWNADGLANLEVGKEPGRLVSYRFRAQHSGNVDTVMVYLIFRKLGYYRGDGGQVLLELQTDDGSDEHLPSGRVLASALVTDPMKVWNRLFVFERPALLREGNLYHLVFSNPAPDPIHNYVSVDDLLNVRREPAMQPGVSDLDLAEVWKPSGRTPWAVNYGHTPIYCLHYADGFRQGQGYINATSESGLYRIAGKDSVREVFVVGGVDRQVSEVAVRVRRASGGGGLHVRLEDDNGTLIEEGIVPAAELSESMNWTHFSFHSPHLLQSGHRYHLVVSAMEDGHFQTFPLREGTGSGFGCPEIFSDGFFEHTSGHGWQPHLDKGFDLQFYFTLARR